MRRSDARPDGVRRRSAAHRHLLPAVFLIAIGSRAAGSPPGQAPPADRRAAALAAFQDARLGLAIRWGLYTPLGKGEDVMERDRLPIVEYARLLRLFDPAAFDPESWVKLAKGAGARYLVVDAKHHDGFCLFDSKLTDYDVVDATKFRADPLKGLAEACRRQGIKLFFAYSLLDWHHPDYFPLGRTGRASGREGRGDWKRYVAYYQGQIRELCTNYGEIGGIRLDGCWDRPDADWDLAATYRMIHELQPGALVANDRHAAPMPGEDLLIRKPGAKPGEAIASADRPMEIGLAIRESRGQDPSETHDRSAGELIQALAEAAGRGANLLVEVGAQPDGAIGPEFDQRLNELGKWLSASGDSIYGTRAGPIAPRPWGVSTVRGRARGASEIYLHVLRPDAESPILLKEATASWTPYLLGKDEPLKLNQAAGGMTLQVPRDAGSPVDTIIVLRPLVMER